MFELDEKQWESLSKWLKKHNKKCKYSDSMSLGAIGGRLTYSFTPTGLGHIINVECACGQKCELTNVDDW